MNKPCQSNSLLTGAPPVVSEVEVGWRPGMVYMSGMLYSTAQWTPEQALQLAALLAQCAEKTSGVKSS